MSVGLTPLQASVFACIQQYVAAHGYPPTYRKIMALEDISSTSTIARVVDALIERGRLRWHWGSLEVLQPLETSQPRLHIIYGPGHWEDRARIKRAQYAAEREAA